MGLSNTNSYQSEKHFYFEFDCDILFSKQTILFLKSNIHAIITTEYTICIVNILVQLTHHNYLNDIHKWIMIKLLLIIFMVHLYNRVYF